MLMEIPLLIQSKEFIYDLPELRFNAAKVKLSSSVDAGMIPFK